MGKKMKTDACVGLMSIAARTGRLAVGAVSIALLLGAGVAAAADPAAPGSAAPAAGCVRGVDLMSPDERTQYHAQMRGLSAEEHAKFMTAHHAAMQARAAEKGVTLCRDTMGPGMMGGGMGKGPGGPGKGPGPAVPPASGSADPKGAP